MAHFSFSLPLLVLLIALALELCSASQTSPAPASSNAKVCEPAIEFPCTEAKWNKEKLRRTIDDILKTKPRKFMRFRAPVINYEHPQLNQPTTGENVSGRITWIWVAGKFSYLLRYPQNFQTLALGTTDVISKNTKVDEIQINCTGCGEGVACGVGFFELKEVIESVTDKHGVEWDHLCVEADNGVLDIVSPYPPERDLTVFTTRNFALPDILYQSRFLKLFFSRCSFLSLSCRNVTNYFCYSRGGDGSCKVQELLRHYPKIIYLSVLLWLFFPLLVIYLPSSKPVYSVTHIPDMFPTHKVPVYLGRYVKNCLCYHTTVDDWNGAIFIRLRRALGFFILSALSFRFLFLPAYQPFSFIVFALFLTAIISPQHLSVYIRPEVPVYFPLFMEPYPAGMVRLRGSRQNSIEYQRLAYIMLERMYLPFDRKFWGHVCENSFKGFHMCFNQQAPMFFPIWLCGGIINILVGIITVSLSVLIVLTYFIVPLPYFAKEFFRAISSRLCHKLQRIWFQDKLFILKLFKSILHFIHGSILSIFLLYLILTLFSLCFLLTEVTIFTYLGASIAADIVFHYIVLLVAFVSTVYAIVHSIHKQYSSILKDVVQIMENDSEKHKKRLQEREYRVGHFLGG